MIPGKTGVVVPADNAHALFNAMRNLTKDSLAIQRMGKEARYYMEERSFEKAFERTWEIYEG
ncbi:MAG: hypothetical protein WCA08_15905, partial [Desulfoferrobacter sp.]